MAQELEGLPYITRKLSGYMGYAQHFYELLGPGLEGRFYFEAVCLGPMKGHVGFHSVFFKNEFGKLGQFDMTSMANMGRERLPSP